MQMLLRWRSTRLVAVLLVLLLGAASCGSDDADDAGSGSGGGGDGGGNAALDEARAFVEKYSKPIDSIGIDEPLSELPEGKEVVVVELPIPNSQHTWRAFKEAGEELGMDVTIIEGGFSPEDFTAGIERAVDMGPDVIAAQAFPPEVYQDVLQPFLDDGGKFMGFAFGTDEKSPLVSVEYGTNDQYAESARAMARWVAVDAEGEGAKIVSHWVLDYPSQQRMLDAFEEELEKACPDCEHQGEAAKATDVGTALPGQVVSYFQRNPDTNYYVAGYGDIAFGIPEALNAAGITGVKGVSSFGTPPNHQMVADENVFVADFSTPHGMFGWILADAAARVLAGDEVPVQEPFGTPFQYLTKEDIDFDPKEYWEPEVDYRAEFKELWGV